MKQLQKMKTPPNSYFRKHKYPEVSWQSQQCIVLNEVLFAKSNFFLPFSNYWKMQYPPSCLQFLLPLIFLLCIIQKELKQQYKYNMGKKGKGKKQVQEEDQKHQEEVAQKVQQQQSQTKAKENQQELKPKVQIVQPKKIQYCPICTFPFQLCKYGKKAAECKKFLMQIAPTKVSKYHPEGNVNNQGAPQQNKQKQEIEQKQVKQNKKQKSVKEKYIHIEVKQRDKKKFTSDISGLSNFKIQSKQLAKKLCKKFACSCSAIDEDKIQVQGDFFQDIKQILINDYKIKKKYILDKDEFKQKVGQQKEKKKEQKKIADNAIEEKAQQEQDESKKMQEPPKQKAKTKIQDMLAGLSDEQKEEKQQN